MSKMEVESKDTYKKFDSLQFELEKYWKTHIKSKVTKKVRIRKIKRIYGL